MVADDQITSSILRILAPNPSPMTLDGTNSYLVGEDELVVIDPGPDIPEHVDAIVAAASARGRITTSVVTHHHGDHLPAAIRLRERIGAAVAGHPELPGVDRALSDDELVRVGALRLRAIATPGHTADHMCYFLEGERALFTGDLIAGSGTVVVGDGRYDLADYMASLRRVAELEAQLLLPGHGPISRSPAAKIREYLEHRLLREGQILDQLEFETCTVEQLVEAIYVGLMARLRPMAARNVRAHLWKLEYDGRASESDGRWQLVGEGARR